MEQALLGGDECAGAIDGDRPTFEDDGNRPHLVADRLGIAARQGGIVGVRLELATPRVERPVEGDPMIALGDVDRPRVPEP